MALQNMAEIVVAPGKPHARRTGSVGSCIINEMLETPLSPAETGPFASRNASSRPAI